jgi:MerR family transcriptional regulator, light-induced transcriptional regulator
MLQNNTKPIYPLQYVTEETGVKADTLRAWERRYGLPNPSRSAGGQRLYSEQDIKIIQWLLMQKKSGKRISQAVTLWKEREERSPNPPFNPTEKSIGTTEKTANERENQVLTDTKLEWMQSCLEFNEFKAEQVLFQAFSLFPMETVCTQILQAGLSEIGSLWHRGEVSIQQEHFATQLAVRRMNTLISSAPLPLHTETIIIACPEGEQHTFSALMLTLFLRYRGWNVVYLGANLPNSEIRDVIATIQPNLVVMIAMRLATAATLMISAQIIHEMDTVFAFGGWVFNHQPNLEQNIPGTYLGKSLAKSIPVIENLISKPFEKGSFHLTTRYSELIDAFDLRKNQIKADILETLKSTSRLDDLDDYLQQANDYLSEDISAALRLDDISLVEQNVTWVKQLFNHRNLPIHFFKMYLGAFSDAVQRHLGTVGRPIIEWVAEMIKD